MRVDVLHPSLVGELVGRIRFRLSDSITWRIDLGLGGGEVYTPVGFGTDTWLARSGPFIASLGTGFGFEITTMVAIVAQVELRVALPEFGLLIDACSLGVELSF